MGSGAQWQIQAVVQVALQLGHYDLADTLAMHMYVCHGERHGGQQWQGKHFKTGPWDSEASRFLQIR